MPGVISKVAEDLMMEPSIIQKKKNLVKEKKLPKKQQQSDSDESDEDVTKKVKKEKRSASSEEEDEDHSTKKSSSKTAKESKKSKAMQESSSSTSTDESDAEVKKTTKLERKAAKEARKRKTQEKEESSEEGEEEEERGGSKKQKRKGGDDVSSSKEESTVLTTAQYRDKVMIKVVGANCPEPFQTFESTPFSKSLLQTVSKAGFSSPSPIQAQCWPIALTGRDLIAIAKTGSGKTVGYLFPAFSVLNAYPTVCRRGDGPVAVVLAPTRELAMQIQTECERFCASLKLKAVCVYGGMPKGPHIRECMMGCHLLIATPGRMNDFLGMTSPPVIPLKRCRYLVLDEADRMLDMGFEPQIKLIFEAVKAQNSAERLQSIMFTATWPKAVQAMAAKYLHDPYQVTIGTSGDKLTANEDVTQIITKVAATDKDHELVTILNGIEDKDSVSVIVFANKKYMCDRIVKGLAAHGWTAVSIHGDKDQWERQKALQRFTRGEIRVIVATDVAARGLDIKGVTHVINYDFPDNGVEDWVHRVGRTGRAGAKGTAITLFHEGSDRKSAAELVCILKRAKQSVPDWLEALGKSSRGNGKQRWSSWGYQKKAGGGGRGGGGGGGRGGRFGGGRGGWGRK